MTPQNIVPVTGLNDVSGSGLLIANSLIRTAKNVKIYRSQCEHLSRQCLDLTSALCDHSPGLGSSGAQQAVDEVERVLTRILNRVRKWEEMGKMRSFVKQTEIRLGLDESYRELRTCSMRFNIALHLDASNRSRELEEILKHDHDELIEMMTRALHDNSFLKIALAGSTLEDAHNVVQVIEQELKEADVGETEERQLQEDFGELRKWVEGLPTMDDLTGKVVRTSNHPIASGGSQDIYTGTWTGKEVALAYPRNQSRAAQERFRRQVEIWRALRHPNVLQLLGIAYIGDFVYSVSPYMEFGHIKNYLKHHPEANRVLLLSEVASATEYLHMSRIIHGDLQGSNVLISGDGQACLSDFGSARVEEAPVTEGISHGSLRWLAPELIADSNYVPTTRATDAHISNEAYIPLVIRDGSLPTRPETNISMRGLSDAMWNLMNQCWQRDPESRPSMSEIREAIQDMNLRISSRKTRSLSNNINVRPSGLTMSRPPGNTGLTPPTAPVPIIKPVRDEVELEHAERGMPASFPMRKGPILNIPLSSSPPSQAGLGAVPRSAPGRPSPLSIRSQVPLPSTSLESRTSASASIDHSDWLLKPPLLLPELSAASHPELSLLLQPVQISSSPKSPSVDYHRRTGSTSTGSVHSFDKSPSIGGHGALLDAAVRDAEPLLRRTADGTVEAGTLEGLVQRVTKDTHDHVKDNEVRRVFLATYHLFTTSEDLFKKLKGRFEEMGDVQTSIPSASVRYSTLLFLRTWLRDQDNTIGPELLSCIREFARSISGSDVMREVVQEIVDLTSEKINVIVISPTSPTRSHSETKLPPSLDQIKPGDIAISLAVIEGDCYNKITEVDYIAHLRGISITKHIESATSINNRLANWVKTKILSSEDVNKRAANFRRFVLVAEECRKLQNFASMSAIVAALLSVPQLILTRESKLAKSEKQLLRQLDGIISPHGDHRAYREALQSVNSQVAIPWLAVHLRGLQSFYDRTSATTIIDQRTLINFSRCARLLARIDEVRRYRAPRDSDLLPPPQPPPDKRRSILGDRGGSGNGGASAALALACVKRELDGTPAVSSREQFEARAAALAEIERQMRDRRELELRSLGFDTVPRHRKSSSGSSMRSPGEKKASLDSRFGRI